MLPKELAWAEEANCAITVCDVEGTIIYMNRRACETFASHGDLIGKNLFSCHSAGSQEKIRHMLATGESNAYTISKNGLRKMIYQTPWRVDGKIAGMAEISMVIPEEMPHYIR
ncbi:MAG: PAS domain-containing protein [Muribaculaceae bacterium]|nr:PAS domain-containing protein [Muribaculaceae bacterium]